LLRRPIETFKHSQIFSPGTLKINSFSYEIKHAKAEIDSPFLRKNKVAIGELDGSIE